MVPSVAGCTANVITDKGFGEVPILAGDQTHPFPEILAAFAFRLRPCLPAGCAASGVWLRRLLTDLHQRTQSIVRVWPHKEVNAGAATLGPLHQLF